MARWVWFCFTLIYFARQFKLLVPDPANILWHVQLCACMPAKWEGWQQDGAVGLLARGIPSTPPKLKGQRQAQSVGKGTERSWDELKEREEAAGAEHTVKAGGAGLVPSLCVLLECPKPLPHPNPQTASPSPPVHRAVEQQVVWQILSQLKGQNARKLQQQQKSQPTPVLLRASKLPCAAKELLGPSTANHPAQLQLCCPPAGHSQHVCW